MSLSQYLPSSHFATIAASIGLAAVLVVGAQYLTAPAQNSAQVVSANQPALPDDWQAALEQIQATAPGLPEAPNPDAVAELLGTAQSSNVTDTVARSLLINLTDASAQGMGSDIPTQEKLIADAQARIPGAEAAVYASADLTVVPPSKESLHTWGNRTMGAFAAHPDASVAKTYEAISQAIEQADSSALGSLRTIAKGYAALAQELADTPVPQTLAPLHLQMVNNLARMAYAGDEMGYTFSDPLRGLTGLQTYQSALDEAARVLTTLAEQLNKNGILFSKDEAGAQWSAFLTSP